MRVNIYHEELTHDAQIVWTEPRPGVRYCGLRIFQKSAPELHGSRHQRRPGDDDDRSAVTFWVGSLKEAKEFIHFLDETVDAAWKEGKA